MGGLAGLVDDKHTLVEELATRHGQQLRRFLRSRVRNAADIPDIIQEVFLRLLRVPNHETIRAPEAYIYTVAHHVAQQHSLESTPARASAELGEVLSELRAVTETDPALEVIAQQCVELLDGALMQLSPKAQATFLLYRRDGKSMDEISQQLGISRLMAKKYLVKTLVHFRKRLKDAE
ncbi:MAG TPA: RNA polymerase sigma factor [Bryobacteraceae bacterium]|nr:RNA polymerase sigma factor [Bryobacteraceae bacterium]